MRITTVIGKISFVVVGIVAGYLALLAIRTVEGAEGHSTMAVGAVLEMVMVVIAARSFRGSGEPVSPQRLWWRMTARPTSGFLLSVLFAGQVAAGVSSAGDPATIIASALIAVAYLASSATLALGAGAHRQPLQ
jgi:hypothetical protein